jgi:outer membrane protein assembly factor BamB
VRGAGRPYVGASAVYVGFSDGALLALSRERGAVLWERQLGDPVRFKDIDAEPAFSDGRLYVPSYDGKLFCLNLVDGKTIWAVEYGGFQTPIIEGGVIYTSTSQGKVVALEKATGKLIWERDFVSTVATTPALYKGLLLVGLWSGKFQALDLKTGKTVGGYSTGRGIASQPVVDVESDLVFATGVNGDLYAFKIGWYRSGDLWYWERQSSRL